MITTAPASSTTERRATTDLSTARTAALGLLVVLLPVARVSLAFGDPPGTELGSRAVNFGPFDVALAALLAIAVADGRARALVRLPSSVSGWLVAAFGATFAVALLAHPSPRGIDLALRLLACGAVVDAWLRTDARTRQRLTALAVGVAAAQAALAIVQAATGRPLALPFVAHSWELFHFGDIASGRGGFTHPYHLAYFLLVGILAGVIGHARSARRLPWLAGIALCSAGVAVTYSRGALLAIGSCGAVLVVAAVRERRHAWPAAAIAVGFVLLAVPFADGWQQRYANSTGSDADSGRRELWSQAWDLARDEPATGVGPGRYVIALDERIEDETLLPAHDVFLHVAAELGMVGAALAAALAFVALRSLRHAGAIAAAGVCLLAPFFVLDAYPYSIASGLTASAIALALLADVRARTDDGSMAA